MFTFEDIITNDLVYLNIASLNLKKIIEKYEIRNFQDLKDFASSKNDLDTDTYLETMSLLRKADKTLVNLNNGIFLVKVYNWLDNENDVLNNLIIKTDKEVLASFLPCILTSPSGSIKQASLRKVNIYDLKYLSSKITYDGKNALIKLIYGIGQKNIAKIEDKINFYNEQLQRVFKENPDIKENLFFLHQEEKKEIIKDNFKDIIRQLFSLGDKFIFGKVANGPSFAESLIKLYNYYKDYDYNVYKHINKNDLYNYRCILIPLIELITNYTTLEELKSGSITNVLKRFVK